MILNGSVLVAAAVTRATAARQRHAIGADKFPGECQHVKTAAPFARGGFLRDVLRFLTHAFPKFSAIATALRMALDLFTVS